MARILAISSQVACGAVGLSVIAPALQGLGHEVIALPTVVLSNHPGHAHVAGTRIEPEVLRRMFDALDANGWLDNLQGIMTGYLPTVAHAAFAAEAVGRVRERNRVSPVYLCDPVLGDDPKGLYIAQDAAEAVRDWLVPVADMLTPNRFELSFLSGADVWTAAEALAACPAGRITLATSIPGQDGEELLNVLCGAPGDVLSTRVRRRVSVPNGTGDLFSAYALSAWIGELYRPRDFSAGERPRPTAALVFATAGVEAALDNCRGSDALAIGRLPRSSDLSWPVERLGAPAPPSE